MAIIDDDVFTGKLRGKFGGCIVYKRLGKTCIRSCPGSRKLTDAGQIAQQRRISSLNIFYKALKFAGLAKCWNDAEKPAGWSGYNLFISKNISAFAPNGFIGDAEKVCLTVGTGIYLPDELIIRQTGEGTWVLTWKNVTCYPSGDAGDRMVLALMQGRNRFAIKIFDEAGVACRHDECAEFKLPAAWQGYVHLYCFMRSESGMVSECKYFLLNG
ncbi:hypothetical protein [Odoribacter lunatus]|uniref:hypothetical protein n=1 Tax=Odoribacter lunatus TaxID=2941335 RepID=UPI00203F97CE|nr:hypothetical protein [Odoribacter lunatus]